jgi:hypothetical protein
MDFQSSKNWKPVLSIKKLKTDNQGQVFSIDALFALILITVVIGMSASAVDIAGFKISDYSAGMSLDRIAIDAADILINTPGSLNWEKSNSTSFITPGLAQDNNGSKNSTKILSYNKIAQLKTSYQELMGNILPRGASSSLSIEPSNSKLETMIIGNKTPSVYVSEVAAVNRTVLVNFRDFKVLVNIEKPTQSDHCPHYDFGENIGHEKTNYTNNSMIWNCKCFKITQKDLNTTDFYILTDQSAKSDNMARWILDSQNNCSEEQEIFQIQPQPVNDKICSIIDENNEAVCWLHVLTSNDLSKQFNTYLIGVPKGTSPEDVRIEYLNPQPCFFVFKVWIE